MVVSLTPLSVLMVLAILFCRSSYSYNLVNKQAGTVEGGKIQYYSISVSEILILGLISDSGDADIFVSSTTDTPDSDDYEYCSVSTGLEIIVVPKSNNLRMSIGIQGHIRYDSTHYRLFVLTPSKKDYRDNQIQEVDPETGQTTLIIDVDALWLANEPRIHRLLNHLAYENGVGVIDEDEDGSTIATNDLLSAIKDWVFWFIALAVKILVEVLA